MRCVPGLNTFCAGTVLDHGHRGGAENCECVLSGRPATVFMCRCMLMIAVASASYFSRDASSNLFMHMGVRLSLSHIA